ncbi:GNAT family N-acetyltransferase [Zongyangia hominis]|uniref:GNAT family N-acetyltransferase n=1 Tax=Zongyangia hominis TaxID=2763677 RepID=A0A926EED5_9FIRM|nr:GNAT family N-acetyltransferase [Zongyangia hominis]MBC8570356.1 GNAT family N-acetyltransferase [Zongyangia hominis]
MQITLKTVETEEEIALTARLAKEIWHEHYDALIGVAQVDYMLSHFQSGEAIAAQIETGTVYVLAYWAGEPAGYCAYRPEEEKMFLSKIYVRNELRGRGIGKAFFDHVEENARGKRSVYLTVNKHNDHSIAVYERVGFAVADQVCTDIGEGFYMDDYIMEKALA